MIYCTKCRSLIPVEAFNTPELISCPSCGSFIHVDVFPALFRRVLSGTSGETVMLDKEATCFYHPKKKAVIPCADCGRFLCSLCDVEFKGRHLCLSCMNTGKRKGRIRDLENHRTLYDTIALALAVVPMLLVWPSIITAPLALFMSIRYWGTPTSILRRTKIRLIISIILSSLQIISWTVVIYLLVKD